MTSQQQLSTQHKTSNQVKYSPLLFQIAIWQTIFITSCIALDITVVSLMAFIFGTTLTRRVANCLSKQYTRNRTYSYVVQAEGKKYRSRFGTQPTKRDQYKLIQLATGRQNCLIDDHRRISRKCSHTAHSPLHNKLQYSQCICTKCTNTAPFHYSIQFVRFANQISLPFSMKCSSF